MHSSRLLSHKSPSRIMKFGLGIFLFTSSIAMVHSTRSEDMGDMNDFGEIFGAWLLFAMLGGLVGVLYYFTVIRQPPRPILESFTKRFTIPQEILEKLEKMGEKGKSVAYDWITGVPYIGKHVKESLVVGMKPLKHDVIDVSRGSKKLDDDEKSEDTNNVDMIIGAPLDEESNLGSPRAPASPDPQ